MSFIVDAHQHFWRPGRGDYGWLRRDNAALYRDFLPEELAPHLIESGVRATVLVQAAPTEAETQFLLDLAAEYPFVAGVVGWCDFAARDSAERMNALLSYGKGKLKGFRPMIQDIPDANWIADASLDRAFDELVASELVFDALVKPVHLEALLRRLDRHPRLRVVLDHCAKPDIAAGDFDAWARSIEQLAAVPNVWCKLSGLVTQAARTWSAADLRPYVIHVLRAFGPERVLWGSDWPVLNSVSDYKSWLRIARGLVSEFGEPYALGVFASNAIRCYGLTLDAPGLLLLAPSDNVAVARVAIDAGSCHWLSCGLVRVRGAVPAGFKVAVRSIDSGEKIIKYGAEIGSATRPIPAGSVVHVDNMRSDYLPSHSREFSATERGST
ncbi:MAG TPA: amidohydrolase family protein [Steroidobacter sp.]